MTTEIATLLFSLSGAFGLGLGLAILLGWFFLPAYLSEKGKNLATKEDIAKVTNEVESVKIRYAMLVEEFKATHQLRVAALDRRLHAHQEAFTWWRNLVAHAYQDDIGKVVLDCQEWWEQNCLYLEATARQALSDAYIFASSHKKLVEGGAHRHDEAYVESIKGSWKRIIDAGQVILQAVELPPLTEREIKAIEGTSRQDIKP